jgi:site-specific DNA-methyltransferase (cytosine-N4-specific)
LDRLTRRDSGLRIEYFTNSGVCVVGDSEALLGGTELQSVRGRVQLVFTSPPFPLNRKKKYGNRDGAAFKEWLRGYATLLRDMLTDDGSIVIEMGNAWEPGLPVMSTLAIESLLEFKKAADLNLCQEFIWYNPAKLPTPAQWVTIERIRVKDAFTRLWWLSPTTKPKANNRNVLGPYSASMKKLLRTQRYNAGTRPSEHVIGSTSFLRDNGGSISPNVLSIGHDEDRDIPSSVLTGSNTGNGDAYDSYCKRNGIAPHPARMPRELAEFFVKFCTDEGDLVLDPFSGSNTTGAAAESLGRKWLSIEANLDYAKGGVGRFSDGARTPRRSASSARTRA